MADNRAVLGSSNNLAPGLSTGYVGNISSNQNTASGLTQLSGPAVPNTLVPQAQQNQTSSYDAQQAYYDRLAREEEARKAAEEAQKGQLRGSISGLIDQALGVYDTLYGNARTAAQSQRGLLEQRYNKETGSLTDQFNAELPKIGRSFAGRGAYDSSYRIEGEAEAGKQFQNQLTDLETQKQADQAKIGQALMEQEAQFGTGKSLLDLTRSQLPQVSDLNELMSVQNEINRKIAELRGSAAGLQSQEAYTQKFGEIAPTGDRMAQLSATLSNIVNGQAPTALKRAVAQQVIGSAGLPEEEKQQLNAQIIQQIG